MTDSLFADVSEFQVPVDDSYPDEILSFRSNDGTYQDHNFYQNYRWACAAADSGKIECFIVYFYWRSNWDQTVQTHIDMVTKAGGPHPKMITMIDVESGGNPGGDQSDGINRSYWKAADWLGNPKRVIGYANRGDFDSMWRTRPDGLRMVGAGYGTNPNLPGQIAHQYTDGQGFGGGLPEGRPPFGRCDMNAANGFTPKDFAAVCGVGEFPGPVVNQIDAKYADSAWLGNRITQGEAVCPDGVGRYAQFDNGYIYWHPEAGAHPIPANLFGKFGALGWEAGSLGYPTQDHTVLPDGECQAFQRGLLYRQDPKGDVFCVHGAIGDRWAREGFERSAWGWPTSDEYPHDDGQAQDFEHGTLYWSPNYVVAVEKSGK
jgi:hypothetical protein